MGQCRRLTSNIGDLNMLNRLIGAYLFLVALAVGAHTVFEPLYHVSTQAQPYSPAWDILNVLMAAALILSIVCGYMRMSRVNSGGGQVTREYLAANALFYGIMFVSILFFWNWFNLKSAGYDAVGSDTITQTWIIIDALLSISVGAMGVHLVRAGD